MLVSVLGERYSKGLLTTSRFKVEGQLLSMSCNMLSASRINSLVKIIPRLQLLVLWMRRWKLTKTKKFVLSNRADKWESWTWQTGYSFTVLWNLSNTGFGFLFVWFLSLSLLLFVLETFCVVLAVLNLLCRPGWPRSHRDPPASWVLGWAVWIPRVANSLTSL